MMKVLTIKVVIFFQERRRIFLAKIQLRLLYTCNLVVCHQKFTRLDLEGDFVAGKSLLVLMIAVN